MPESAFLVYQRRHSYRQARRNFKKSRPFCAEADAYMFVYLTGKFGSKYEAKSEANAQPNISKSSYSSAEVIFVGKNVLGRKEINCESGKDGNLWLDILAKVANMR